MNNGFQIMLKNRIVCFNMDHTENNWFVSKVVRLSQGATKVARSHHAPKMIKKIHVHNTLVTNHVDRFNSTMVVRES